MTIFFTLIYILLKMRDAAHLKQNFLSQEGETIMKNLFFVFIVLSMTCFAQIDSLDRVELKDNNVFAGKVIKVTSTTVQFREAITNLLREFNKSEIKDIKLSNGVTVSFNTPPVTPADTANRQNITGNSKTGTETQNQAVGSSRTPTQTKDQTVTKGQTETKSQAAQNTAPPADEAVSKMDTSMIVVLAAGGLVVLLLLGALIL